MLGVAVVAVALGLVLLGLQFARVGTDPSAPFFVGSAFGLDDELAARGIDVEVVPGTGYDGQWFLGLAYDPLLLDDVADGFDMPRYRAGRPLLGIAGWVLSAGRLLPVPAGVLAASVLALGLGAAAAGRLAAGAGLTRWLGLGFCLVPGVAVGVMHGTAEPLGLAFALTGLSLAAALPLAGGRRLDALPAGLAFAAAGLTKETYLLFGAVAAGTALLGTAAPLGARVWRAALLVLPGAAGLALWWGWVVLQVPGSGADVKSAEAVAAPMVGWVGTLGDMLAGRWVADAPVGPLGIGFMLGSIALAAVGVWAGLRRPGLLGWTALAFGLYATCMSGYLLGHFLSSMRALAPSVLAALLGVTALFARAAGAEEAGGTRAAPVSPAGRAAEPSRRRAN
jgi:hypothetical protein